MLFQKLLKPASASTGIQYVGATTSSGTTSGGTVTVSLTGLTGGIASSPSIGDIVVISIGVAGATSQPVTPTVTGYTQIATTGATDTNATRIYTGYKILTAADTSVAYSWTASNGSSTAYVSVWRNVDATYPLDVAAKTVSQQNGILINPSAITPITSGAYIVVAGAGANSAGIQTYGSSDLNDFRSLGVNNTYDSVIGGGYNQWTSGAFDPAAFTFSSSDSATYSCASTTLALRPSGKTNPSLIASAGVNSSTVTVPSHQAGDWLVFVAGNNSATPQATVSGFTSIGTFNSTNTSLFRSGRLQYIVSDGTITTINGGGVYASVAVLRNVTGIGATNFVNTSTNTAVTGFTASLTPTIPASICLLGCYSGGSLTNATGTGITLATNFGGKGTTDSFLSSFSASLSFSPSVAPCYFGAEFY
jgi:hypothetical protein